MTFIQLKLLAHGKVYEATINTTHIISILPTSAGTLISFAGNPKPDMFVESYKDVIKMLKLNHTVTSKFDLEGVMPDGTTYTL